MTLRTYLAMMAAGSLFCWALFTYSLFFIDPEVTNWAGFALFYASAFLALVGTTAIFGFLLRFVIMRKALAFRLVADAFRQSFLFSTLVVTILYLMSKQLFSWTNSILLAVGLAVLEFFLVSGNGAQE